MYAFAKLALIRTLVASGCCMILPSTNARAETPPLPQVAHAVERAERLRSDVALGDALDLAWKADDWVSGLRVARLAVGSDRSAVVRARAARALWRAGELTLAENVMEALRTTDPPPLELAMKARACLSRGQFETARRLASRIEAHGAPSAADLFDAFSVRLATQRTEGSSELLARLLGRLDPHGGYPDSILGESVAGMPVFFERIGPASINVVRAFGVASMPMLLGFRLPYCQAMINGVGPFRLIVDTGGSATLSLSARVARELNLTPLARARVHGVAGAQDSDQTLVDSLAIGEAELSRVMTRVFEFPAPIEAAADGILGTGVFLSAQLTLDFAGERLILSPSDSPSAGGQPVDLRIVADAKLIAPARVNKSRCWAVLDTGADALAFSPSLIRDGLGGGGARLPVAGLGVGTQPAVPVTAAPDAEVEIWGREVGEGGAIGLEALDSLLSPIMGIQTDVLAGMPLFRKMRLFVVDYPRCRAWVEWTEPEAARPRESGSPKP